MEHRRVLTSCLPQPPATSHALSGLNRPCSAAQERPSACRPLPLLRTLLSTVPTLATVLVITVAGLS